MECETNNNEDTIKTAASEFNTLQKIVDQLRKAGYSNEQGFLVCNLAFAQLEQLAKAEQVSLSMPAENDDYPFEEQRVPEEPFHIEADIYDSGDYANLLVIPSNGSYIVVGNNEHLATMVKTCEDPLCWEQQDGNLDEEVVEKMGTEISNFIASN